MKQLLLFTAYNKEFGSGHFWRMTTLLKILRQAGLETFLLSDHYPNDFPQNLKQYSCQGTSPSNLYNIIIKDKRDSSLKDIYSLKKHCGRLITIDDSGEGDQSADLSIKLLPVDTEKKTKLQDDYFLYGYNFYSEILQKQSISNRKYDIAFYNSLSDINQTETLVKKLAEKFSVLEFNATKRILHHNGITKSIKIDYSDILCLSKVCISHFGITHYEAALCGAYPVSINPTKYHSCLAENETNISITNLGAYSDLNINTAIDKVTHLIKKECIATSLPGIKEKLRIQQTNFIQCLDLLIQ